MRLGMFQRARRMRKGPSGPVLPAGAYHYVDYLAANTTVAAGKIASATEQGTVGGAMVASTSPIDRRPATDTVNGIQFGDFTPDGSTRKYTESNQGVASWPFGAKNDDDFMVAILFKKGAGQRFLMDTMNISTATNGGFYARYEASGVLKVGMSPTGEGAWKGQVSSSAMPVGWHVALLQWGNGTYEHYLDDMATAFSSGSYTWSGTGGDATSPLRHGAVSDGPPGIGSVVLYERKSADQAEREQIRDALLSKLGLYDYGVPNKAAIAHVADPANLTLSGTDLTSWANLVPGGPAAEYSDGAPASPAEYVTTQFGGKGSIEIETKAPPYYPKNTLGNFSNWWFGLKYRTSSSVTATNLVALGGGAQFACGASSGDFAVFDGAYVAATAPVSNLTEYTVLWVLNGASSFDVYVNGTLADSGVSLDGNVFSDNLPFTIGGYNKSAGGVTHVRAVIGGNVTLSTAEIAEVHAWLDAQ